MAKMDDVYANFWELSDTERPDIDYRICMWQRASPIAIIAPHGGKIEPGTSAVASLIAGHTFSLYCFEGIKPVGNHRLHITSTHFDEPNCLHLVAASDYVVAIHGCQGNDRKVHLGGLDHTLLNAIQRTLVGSGFETGTHPDSNVHGVSPHNVCNRGRRRMGVQLELPRGLRDELEIARLKPDGGAATQFATAMRRSLMHVADAG